MLSAAHVLAMDAKNLLDVVDSIRLRYPELFQCAPQNTSPSIEQATCTQQIQIALGSMPQPAQDANVDSYEMMQRQTYQNLSELADQTVSIALPETDDGGEDLYANQQQLGQQGIYDNDCILSAQLNKLNVASDTSGYVSAVDSIATPKLSPLPPAKPPVAAKPVNLQQKLKPNLSTIASAPPSQANAAVNSAEDSLKIVEHEPEWEMMSVIDTDVFGCVWNEISKWRGRSKSISTLNF